MCLAVPGKIVERWEGAGGLPFGKVRFGSVAREVCLAYTPEAGPGDYVIVHVGFAIQRLDEAAAARTLAALGEAMQEDAGPEAASAVAAEAASGAGEEAASGAGEEAASGAAPEARAQADDREIR
jgi:hydrogenase expression/formation protein HypC